MTDSSQETPAQKNRESSKKILMRYLDLGSLSAENKMLRSLLYDEITGLPTLSLFLDEITFTLKTKGQVGILYLDIERSAKIQEAFGYQVFDQTLNIVSRVLDKLRGTCIRKEDTVAAVMKCGNAFVVLLSPPRKQKQIKPEDLLNIRKRLVKTLRSEVKKQLDPNVYRRFYCRCGTALIESKPGLSIEHLVFNAVERARENASDKELEHRELKLAELRQAIELDQITTVFQPVVHLDSKKVIAYEAFSRGPKGIEDPETLFKIAHDGDCVWKLDQACREKAFMSANGLPTDFLFINIYPHAIGDPELKNIGDSLALAQSKLGPEQLIFDVSEQSMVDDFELFPTMLHYLKTIGFKICIDDAGSGYYGGLELMARAKPDFVKIDIHLIRNIDSDEIRQDLCETIVKFANKAGAFVSAEGIETVDELRKLQDIGVQFGQGYLFAEPAAPFPKLKRIRAKKSTNN
jgi:EAL domain-containing protein (putative c-di-GMP-specific phosphodiesterase class I)